MTNFAVTDAVVEHIADISNPYFRDLNTDLTAAYPEQPDMIYALAIGFSIGSLLISLSNPQERAGAVNAINILARFAGYALTPVT
jgi:hypothetical protein